MTLTAKTRLTVLVRAAEAVLNSDHDDDQPMCEWPLWIDLTRAIEVSRPHYDAVYVVAAFDELNGPRGGTLWTWLAFRNAVQDAREWIGEIA